MASHGTGRVRMEFIVPVARPHRLPHRLPHRDPRHRHRQRRVSDGYGPWAGEIRARHTGSLVSDRTGSVTAYAMIQLADRGTFFVEPGADTYEGMVVGDQPAREDLDVNVTREKKLTNMRVLRRRDGDPGQPIKLELEGAMEFCAGDECVEVAPEVVRVRKVTLDSNTRARERSRTKARNQSVS